MIQISTKDKERVLEAIRKGTIEAADVGFPNLIDAIILKMKEICRENPTCCSQEVYGKQAKIRYHIFRTALCHLRLP